MKNKKSLLGRIGLPLAFAGILGSCATVQDYVETEQYYKELERRKELLGVYNASDIKDLRNGYYTNMTGQIDLIIVAGIATGDVKVERIPNGYKSEGTFSPYLNPEALQKACELADRNKDNIITSQESGDLILAAYEVATRNK